MSPRFLEACTTVLTQESLPQCQMPLYLHLWKLTGSQDSKMEGTGGGDVGLFPSPPAPALLCRTAGSFPPSCTARNWLTPASPALTQLSFLAKLSPENPPGEAGAWAVQRQHPRAAVCPERFYQLHSHRSTAARPHAPKAPLREPGTCREPSWAEAASRSVLPATGKPNSEQQIHHQRLK